VIFEKIYILQSSVATQLRCGGIFNNHFIANFPQSVSVKDFFLISQYLAKIWTKAEWHLIMAHRVFYSAFRFIMDFCYTVWV